MVHMAVYINWGIHLVLTVRGLLFLVQIKAPDFDNSDFFLSQTPLLGDPPLDTKYVLLGLMVTEQDPGKPESKQSMPLKSLAYVNSDEPRNISGSRKLPTGY